MLHLNVFVLSAFTGNKHRLYTRCTHIQKALISWTPGSADCFVWKPPLPPTLLKPRRGQKGTTNLKVYQSRKSTYAIRHANFRHVLQSPLWLSFLKWKGFTLTLFGKTSRQSFLTISFPLIANRKSAVLWETVDTWERNKWRHSCAFSAIHTRLFSLWCTSRTWEAILKPMHVSQRFWPPYRYWIFFILQ